MYPRVYVAKGDYREAFKIIGVALSEISNLDEQHLVVPEFLRIVKEHIQNKEWDVLKEIRVLIEGKTDDDFIRFIDTIYHYSVAKLLNSPEHIEKYKELGRVLSGIFREFLKFLIE